MEKNIFEKIKERPVRSAAQALKAVLLIIVTGLLFLMTAGRVLLNVIYIAALIVIAIVTMPAFIGAWLLYAAAAVIGLVVINLLAAVLSGALAAAQQELLVSLFGHPDDESEGGAVPLTCVKPFDPTEKALNELEMEYERNAVTEEEYLKRKEEILKNGGNN